MKKIWIVFFVVLFTKQALAQYSQLLMINQQKKDTVVFNIGEKIIVTTGKNKQTGGRLTNVTNESLNIGEHTIAFNSILSLRHKTPPGIIILRTIGITTSVLASFYTYLTLAFHPYDTEDPHYNHDIETYHQNLIAGTSAFAISTSLLFIHTKKYRARNGWYAAGYLTRDSVVNDPITTTINNQEKKAATVIYNPDDHNSTNAVYGQLSVYIPSLNYDHVWKINNRLHFLTGVGVGPYNNKREIIAPVTLGLVIGQHIHLVEVSQTSWLPFESLSPLLIGTVAYRLQPYRRKFFLKGGLQIIEAESGLYRNQLSPFVSFGLGF